MILLGKINIHQYLSVTDLRNKVFTTVEMVTKDAMTSTRVATAVSEMCRTLRRGGNAPSMTLHLSEDHRQTTLRFAFEDMVALPPYEFMSPFFNEMQVSHSSEGTRVLHAWLHAGHKLLSEHEVIRLKELIARKDRDELMAELQDKNQELQNSLENLKRTTSAKDRMESELNIGHDIQMSMLPLKFPPFPDRKELDIHAVLKPAREVGGDFYDFFFIDEDRFCFCVGDVSGKGVPAALFMAVTKTLIKSRATNDYSPASILTHVNDELARDNPSCMFITIFVTILDLRTGKLRYCNAGHNPSYIKHSGNELRRLDERHGPVVAAMEGTAYGEDMVQLNGGEFVILYTDGIPEAMNNQKELFTEQRLAEWLNVWQEGSVDELTSGVIQEVEQFEEEAERADDITIVVLEYHGRPKGTGQNDVKVHIKNRLEEINQVSQAVMAFAKKQDVPQSVISQLNIAIDELLNNVITYGFKDEGEHEIEVYAEIIQNRIVLTISDDGIPFNPFDLKKPDTTLSLEDREIGGLGIHLVKQTMNDVEYHRQIDRNVVTLIKQF